MCLHRTESDGRLSNAYLLDDEHGVGVLVDGNGVAAPLLEVIRRDGLGDCRSPTSVSTPSGFLRVAVSHRRGRVMVSRVSQMWFNPKKLQAAAQWVQDVLVAECRKQDGFRGMQMHIREDGYTLFVTAFDTKEQLRATESSGWYQRMHELFPHELFPHEQKGMLRRNFYGMAVMEGFDRAA
jgi:hypothetical protein